MEEQQYQLFCLLASWPAPGSTPTPSQLQAYTSNLRRLLADEEQQQQQQDQGQGPAQAEGGAKEQDPSALLYLLRFLLHKNSGSLMDVQPPGLSDATVLMSAFFALLRMLQPAIAAAGEGRGPLAAFPAAATFAVAASAASSPEAEVIQDMPRFGGLLSFMMRETPLSAADKAPLPVAVPRLLQPTGPDAQLLLQAGVYPELLVGCLLLYSWRVGLRLRTLHSLAGQLSSNAAKLAEVERALQSHQAPEGGQVRGWSWVSRWQDVCVTCTGVCGLRVRAFGVYTLPGGSLGVALLPSPPPGPTLLTLVCCLPLHLPTLSPSCHIALPGPQTTQWLLDSRSYYREELGRDMRILALLRTAFFSPSKQVGGVCLLATLSTTASARLGTGACLPGTPTAARVCSGACHVDTTA